MIFVLSCQGLDPAMPWFDLVSEEHRIQSTDADFVDIIHTNSGNLIVGDLSFPDPLGQVDFYPNGGSHQNGCFYLKGTKRYSR